MACRQAFNWITILLVVPVILCAVPESADAQQKDTVVCLSHQLIVPKNWDKLTWNKRRDVLKKYREAVERAVVKANRILKANKAGIKIELSGDLPYLERDPKKLKKQKAQYLDEHCIELYLDAERAGGSGNTDGENFSVQNLDQVPSGIDQDYQKEIKMGENITMGTSFGQVNSDDINGNTIAHELGHAFGLGMGPTPDDHREIEDFDKKIKDSPNADDRLMRHRNPGDELTDKEKELMRAMAAHYAKTTGTCGNSYHILEGDYYVADKPYADVIYASITSTAAFIRLDAHLAAAAPTTAPISIDIELDTSGDRQADHQLAFYSKNGKWQNEQNPPASNAEYSPFATRLISTSVKAPGVSTVTAWLPRKYLPKNKGEIGWRMRVSIAGTSPETLPVEGFDYFDVTPPAYVVALNPQFRKMTVNPGDIVNIDGTIKPNHQLSGALEVAAYNDDGLFGEDGVAESYVDPEAGKWKAQLFIPENAKAGTYPFIIDVFCSSCKLSETVESTIVVDSSL